MEKETTGKGRFLVIEADNITTEIRVTPCEERDVAAAFLKSAFGVLCSELDEDWIKDNASVTEDGYSVYFPSGDLFYGRVYPEAEVEPEEDAEEDLEGGISVRTEKAAGLPEGWEWIHYGDGSGLLRSPEQESFFGYDLFTKEYQDPVTGRYEFWKNYPWSMDLAEFKEYAERRMAEILKDAPGAQP